LKDAQRQISSVFLATESVSSIDHGGDAWGIIVAPSTFSLRMKAMGPLQARVAGRECDKLNLQPAHRILVDSCAQGD
jgi:hypothetical protein